MKHQVAFRVEADGRTPAPVEIEADGYRFDEGHLVFIKYRPDDQDKFNRQAITLLLIHRDVWFAVTKADDE